MFHILADQNLSLIDDCFSPLGKITYFDGTTAGPTQKQLQEKDILLVRSTTKVDEKLLAGTSIKIVGSATSGMDHIDQTFLKKHGIDLFLARGANSEAVKDYFFWVLFKYLNDSSLKINQLVVGVVGCGRIGSKVVEGLTRLGIKTIVHDPPLKNKGAFYLGGEKILLAEKEALLKANIITFHVPLQEKGEHQTKNLFNSNWLEQIDRPTFFINTSRGEIFAEDTLKKLTSNKSSKILYAFDVWRNEPQIDSQLIKNSYLATPHIAGHSLQAKQNAIHQLYRSISSRIISKDNSLSFPSHFDLTPPKINLNSRIQKTDSLEVILYRLIQQVFKDLVTCDQKMRQNNQGQAAWFIRLRKEYARRTQLNQIQLTLSNADEEIAQACSALGFLIQDPP